MRRSLVLSGADWDRWLAYLTARREERVAFGYCGINTTPDGTQYLLRAVDLPGDDEYVVQEAFRVALALEHVLPRVIRAREHAALVDVHPHLFTRAPWPSPTDTKGAARHRRVVEDLAPGTVIVSLILGAEGTLWAAASDPGGGSPAALDDVVIVGLDGRRVVVPVNATRPEGGGARPADLRTGRVLGAAGVRAVRALKILVIGVGGIGSAVVAMLRGYVGTLGVVDHDVVEIHNAPRLFHYAAGDEGRPKVAIQARGVREGFPGVAVEAIQEVFPSPASVELFKRADVIFCCPDHNAVRYDAARLGARFLKPVIEVGCGGRASDGRISRLGYHVRLQVPGGPCLACNGMDLSRLEDPATTAGKVRVGYVEGGDDLVAGELVPLTARAAADAVDVCLRYITGYVAHVPRHLHFDAMTLRTLDATAAYESDPACTLCGDGRATLRAAGDALTADQEILSPPGVSHAIA